MKTKTLKSTWNSRILSRLGNRSVRDHARRTRRPLLEPLELRHLLTTGYIELSADTANPHEPSETSAFRFDRYDDNDDLSDTITITYSLSGSTASYNVDYSVDLEPNTTLGTITLAPNEPT